MVTVFIFHLFLFNTCVIAFMKLYVFMVLRQAPGMIFIKTEILLKKVSLDVFAYLIVMA